MALVEVEVEEVAKGHKPQYHHIENQELDSLRRISFEGKEHPQSSQN